MPSGVFATLCGVVRAPLLERSVRMPLPDGCRQGAVGDGLFRMGYGCVLDILEADGVERSATANQVVAEFTAIK
eukprot:10810713-Alexandrium_andersonii.AAC.1